ncbi:hypothetical protein FSARC_8256 [Fusarium sarcochroum]|uniref:Uncharacterized protein n=1 Tax=Fusarium sarcochroum TaxID=1208366 RepID=A0A8H4TTN1_9HYPO|nr:hypothetical protein FSARC_8256 [Fusarium sarcochroum]
MSDNIDPRMVEMACMADLSRLRQEELPLSYEEKRGPSYAPTGRNGTGQYSATRKGALQGKWSTKIVDEESKQMEGLENEDARPWAYKQAKTLFSTKTMNIPPPPTNTQAFASIARPQTLGGAVQFKPAAPGWESSVKRLAESKKVDSPTVAQWGPPNPVQAPPVQAPPIDHPEPSKSEDVPADVPSPVRLIFTVNTAGLEPNASEYMIGSGNCSTVPGKNEALGFTTTVTMKLRIAENEGVLELRNDAKGQRIHNALDLGDPALDGQYCVVKVRTMKDPYHFRFETVQEAQKFKRCLSKLKKSVRLHQSKESTHHAQNLDTEVKSASPITSVSEVTQVSTCVPEDLAEAATEQPKLITMDGWMTVNNGQLPSPGDTAQRVVNLINQVLSHFSLERGLCAGAIAGIEDAIFEKWTNDGFLKGCNDSLRDASLGMLRSTINMHMKLHSHLTGQELPEAKVEKVQSSDVGKAVKVETLDHSEKESHNHAQSMAGQQQNGSVGIQRNIAGELNSAREPTAHTQGVAPQKQNGLANNPEHNTTRGLSSSRFAKGPVPFQGSFTGPRRR